MYIKKLVYNNVGPLKNITIIPSFTEEGNPKPILLVGENGSGKSTVLSNVVDSFYEIAGKVYSNARQKIGNVEQYYKAIRPADIHVNEKGMFSFIEFSLEDSKEIYLCVSGNIRKTDIEDKTKSSLGNNLSWKEGKNYKEVTFNNEKIEKIWDNNVICYFGPDRYEKPAWLGEKYYKNDKDTHFSIKNLNSDTLYNEINVKNVTEVNLQWLLDVIADSRSDIKNNGDDLVTDHNTNVNSVLLLGLARKNIEKIMSDILGEKIYFGLNYRNAKGSRFRILREKDDSVVVSSLDSLSTGQIVLFNMFATIIRYADSNDIEKSFNFHEIKGIVVIDEIELHLHTKLQREILPKLIKLFPKIQFIITTHAPLFLLGMEEIFTQENFDVYELPLAQKITVERFSEFQKAFEYLKNTQYYQQEVEEAIKKEKSKTLIITEGSTDWKHIKAAYNSLEVKSEYAELFSDLEFEFFEYESKSSCGTYHNKRDMGNKTLVAICENCSMVPQETRYIFIADRDDKNTNEKFSTKDKNFKSWGNNVFSFILPLPKFRENTPEISIEHLYKDEEIKTEYEINGIKRRLYIGNEFDERGISLDLELVCENKRKCGKNSIAIIEGSSGEKITNFRDRDSKVNLALPKSDFASLILSKQSPFDNFNFENFIPIFEIIKEIINFNE